MPLTDFQRTVAKLLTTNRAPDSYLAGGAALHLQPNTLRYSNDLDYFHDSVERVAEAFEADRELLIAAGYHVAIEMNQPGYIRCSISKHTEATKVEWAHDTAWRFLPPIADEAVGYRLHPIDLALNKLLALVGRDEARDFVDILYIDREILPVGALCWAAAGKDPGFTPLSILELLKRRGRYRPEDFSALALAAPIDLQVMKRDWLRALEQAEAFIDERPADEIGCLYYSPSFGKFFAPDSDAPPDLTPHYGRPGGILPHVLE